MPPTLRSNKATRSMQHSASLQRPDPTDDNVPQGVEPRIHDNYPPPPDAGGFNFAAASNNYQFDGNIGSSTAYSQSLPAQPQQQQPQAHMSGGPALQYGQPSAGPSHGPYPPPKPKKKLLTLYDPWGPIAPLAFLDYYAKGEHEQYQRQAAQSTRSSAQQGTTTSYPSHQNDFRNEGQNSNAETPHFGGSAAPPPHQQDHEMQDVVPPPPIWPQNQPDRTATHQRGTSGWSQSHLTGVPQSVQTMAAGSSAHSNDYWHSGTNVMNAGEGPSSNNGPRAWSSPQHNHPSALDSNQHGRRNQEGQWSAGQRFCAGCNWKIDEAGGCGCNSL